MSKEELKKRVFKALTKKPQSSTDIARKLKLVGDNGEPTNYAKQQVRYALAVLQQENKNVIREGQFRTTQYRLE